MLLYKSLKIMQGLVKLFVSLPFFAGKKIEAKGTEHKLKALGFSN